MRDSCTVCGVDEEAVFIGVVFADSVGFIVRGNQTIGIQRRDEFRDRDGGRVCSVSEEM